MSIDYYLFCKDNCDMLLANFEETNRIINLIYERTKEESNVDTQIKSYLFHTCHKNDDAFLCRRTKIKEIKNMLEDKIKQLCEHEFEDDMIDITPDKSKNIIYCKICGLTK